MLDSTKYLTLKEDVRLQELLCRFECRDTLMLRLLRKYGMRGSELLGLRKCDFDAFEGLIRIRGLKGSNDREFPLTLEFTNRLRRMSFDLQDEDRIFPLSYKRLGEIWRMYRQCKKPLHSLRHTCAVEMYRRTKDIMFVKNNLGHKALSSTLIYQAQVNSDAANRKYFCGKA